ncbi:flagellar motor protein MotB [Streptomyces varsoviensis]|uniref:Flagellar motor protein MotB n=1 Tax=Streptomyces varsoviensis TaxID=67373 RepID=A0ABR5ISA2_9ACTN|nr:flagellar motor protein MotB [Streptomyces varsoviensis]
MHTARGGAKAGAGSRRCHTSGLKAAFATGEDAAPDPNASGATTTSVVVTNTSGRTCEIGGFPGVDLKPDAGGPAWSLARSSARHSSITLHPGDSTDFTINLGMAKENEEGSWKPATVAVTPPDETTALTLKWPWGPLVHQDGATHPATFVNPIG